MIPENTTAEYVVLRHLTMPDKGKCFFTTNGELGRSCHGYNGELWYEVVAYANTVPEAQTLCDQHYGGIPSMKEFEDHAREEIEKRYKL
jgi:hypothetical protein